MTCHALRLPGSKSIELLVGVWSLVTSSAQRAAVSCFKLVSKVCFVVLNLSYLSPRPHSDSIPARCTAHQVPAGVLAARLGMTTTTCRSADPLILLMELSNISMAVYLAHALITRKQEVDLFGRHGPSSDSERTRSRASPSRSHLPLRPVLETPGEMHAVTNGAAKGALSRRIAVLYKGQR